MRHDKEIETFLINKFTFIKEKFKLSEPIIKNDIWSTEIYYLFDDIGIEFELDWRDLNVFVLVVYLDNGEIPKGYYIYKNKTCRIHLEKILKEKIKTFKYTKTLKKNEYSKKIMKDQINYYCDILNSYMEVLIDLE